MKSKSATKRALLSSALSLVLCFTMLLGTTFAWFTDSASTAVNTIQSGTLDVVLEYWDGDSWEDAEGKTLSFKKAANAPADEKILWEPGCTYELPAIRVGNAGNLHLKYELVISGIDGDAELNKAIEWSYTANGAAFTAFKGDIAPAVGTATNYGAYENGIVISGHMKEEAGNEYQGLTIDGIGITVYATQKNAEFDSFGPDYDIDSQFGVDVKTADELLAALAQGGSIRVMEDITLPDGAEITKDTAIDLNGKTLTATENQAYLFHVEGDADLTIVNGKLVAESTNGVINGTGTSTGASSSVYFESTGTLTMKDVEIQGSVRGGHRAVQVYGGKADLTNVDITTSYGSGVNSGSGAYVELTDCDITVNGMYSAPYNSVCVSVMGGAEMVINSGNYKMINDNTYNTGDTHGGWVGIVMSSGGTLTTKGGTYTNVPAAGFMPQYERAIFEAENNAPAVSTLNLLGGTFDPQEDQIYGGYGDQYYPIYNNVENLRNNGDGTWTAFIPSADSNEELSNLIADGETFIELAAGSYTMPEPDLRGKTLSISGTKDTVIDMSAVDARDQFVTGATLEFDGVTLNFGSANYMGLANTASLTYKNCTINGLQFLFGENVTFENCDLNSNGAEHCVWTYGVQNVSFTNCDFTYGDRGINCYSDNDVPGGKQTVNFTDCTFTTENTASEGAVEINSYFFSVGIEVNLDGCTAPAHGQMAYVSPWDSTNGAKTTINIK